MGLLVEGKWHDKWYDTKSTGGKFVRQASQFRNWITADGSAGPTGEAGFKAEHGRYHLYVCYACPWAHRALIMRELKGLTQSISISAVHPLMLENGWTFDKDKHGANGDDLYQLVCRLVNSLSNMCYNRRHCSTIKGSYCVQTRSAIWFICKRSIGTRKLVPNQHVEPASGSTCQDAFVIE